ncbi:Gp37 family protein [Rosettibacter firmus]|uniref:Gp37 family protein n=1 Tax=Rosettibacter firmus TaxID=3111522 RepID=UPI00336BFC83
MITEIKNMIKSNLEAAVSNLPQQLRIPVEIPISIDQYKLSHPIGAYLVIYKGSSFKQKDVKNIIAQDRDIEIMVVVTARYREEMKPEEYLDYAIEQLSGYQTDSKRTVYCSQDEWLGEEAGIWSYAATFVVPVEFFQSN